MVMMDLSPSLATALLPRGRHGGTVFQRKQIITRAPRMCESESSVPVCKRAEYGYTRYYVCSSFAVVLVSWCLSNKSGPSDLVLSHRVRGHRAYSGGLFFVLFWWFKAVLYRHGILLCAKSDV